MDRPLICGGESVEKPFPKYLKGAVTKGYGRGSKELGIPTANLPETIAQSAGLDTGIYYGFSSVGSSNTVYPMVMSYGWNPYYKNSVRSAEAGKHRFLDIQVHIMHEFPCDFYDAELRVIVLGFIRPEKSYDGVDALIADIRFDIKVAHASLDRKAYQEYLVDSFLKA